MKRTAAQFFCGLLVTIGLAMTSNASFIYTALTPTGGWSVPPLNGEIGNEVTAAGSDRYVTSLGIEIFSQGGIFPSGNPGFADFRAQLYANDGTGGQPGSLLWQSAVETVNYPGGLSMLTFNVPDVFVPNTFTWTLQYSNTSPIPPGLPGANPPTVGTSDSGWFRAPSSAWTPLSGSLMAQIQAVPEPEVGALLSVAALTFWSWRKRGS